MLKRNPHTVPQCLQKKKKNVVNFERMLLNHNTDFYHLRIILADLLHVLPIENKLYSL